MISGILQRKINFRKTVKGLCCITACLFIPAGWGLIRAGPFNPSWSHICGVSLQDPADVARRASPKLPSQRKNGQERTCFTSHTFKGASHHGSPGPRAQNHVRVSPPTARPRKQAAAICGEAGERGAASPGITARTMTAMTTSNDKSLPTNVRFQRSQSKFKNCKNNRSIKIP